MCEALRTTFKIFSAQIALPRPLEYQDNNRRICMFAGGWQIGTQAPREGHGPGGAAVDAKTAAVIPAAADRHSDSPAAAAGAVQTLSFRHVPLRLHMLRRVGAVHGQRLRPLAPSSHSAATPCTLPATAAAAERRLVASRRSTGTARGGDPAEAGPTARSESAGQAQCGRRHACRQQQGWPGLHCWANRQADSQSPGGISPAEGGHLGGEGGRHVAQAKQCSRECDRGAVYHQPAQPPERSALRQAAGADSNGVRHGRPLDVAAGPGRGAAADGGR